jgi:hypothetical protein
MAFQDTTLIRPWTESIELGRGFSSLEEQVLQSPFEPLVASEPPTAPRVEYQHYDISSSDDSFHDFHAELKASGAVYGIGIQAKYDQSQLVECSATSMTKILRCTITHDLTKVDGKSPPRLTDEAQRLLKSSATTFRRQYGDYYVAGYRRRSSYEAMLTFSAKSRQALQTFKGSLGVGQGFFVNGKVNIDFASAAEESNIRLAITLRSNGIHVPYLDTHPSPSTIEKMFKDFQTSTNPPHHTAFLQHYCLVDSRIDRTPRVHDTPDIDMAVQMGYGLEKACRANRMQTVRAQYPDYASGR